LSIKGFTLLEILIAIVLIVVGLVALMGVMSVGMCADAALEYRLTALNLANEKLEELKDSTYISLKSKKEKSILGFDFVDERKVTVKKIDTNLKDVKVEVKWTQKGSTQSVAVETYIADY